MRKAHHDEHGTKARHGAPRTSLERYIICIFTIESRLHRFPLIDGRKWEACSSDWDRYPQSVEANASAWLQKRQQVRTRGPYLALHGASPVLCPRRQHDGPTRTDTHSHTLTPLHIQRSQWYLNCRPVYLLQTIASIESLDSSRKGSRSFCSFLAGNMTHKLDWKSSEHSMDVTSTRLICALLTMRHSSERLEKWYETARSFPPEDPLFSIFQPLLENTYQGKRTTCDPAAVLKTCQTSFTAVRRKVHCVTSLAMPSGPWNLL
jgi:hypothetical protein